MDKTLHWFLNSSCYYNLVLYMRSQKWEIWHAAGEQVEPSSSAAQLSLIQLALCRIRNRRTNIKCLYNRFWSWKYGIPFLNIGWLHQCAYSFNSIYQTSWVWKPANSDIMKINNVGLSLRSTRDEIEMLGFTKHKEIYVKYIMWDQNKYTAPSITTSLI